MQEYITLYGKKVIGKVVRELENTLVVADASDSRYVVHKRTVDPNFKTARAPKFRHSDRYKINTEERTPPVIHGDHWVNI